MKRKVITCDVCGKEITTTPRYKFNEYSIAPFFREPVKYRRDMCEECFKKFCGFVKIGDNKNE